MPLYTYQCYGCGKVQEVMRSVKDRDKSIACNHCMCASDRIIDLAAFQLKGGGWYKDGYSKKPPKPKQKPKVKKEEKKE